MIETGKITVGSKVRTTFAQLVGCDEWIDHAWAQKRWGVEGTVVSGHNNPDLNYDVVHEDQTKASYNLAELELV